MNRIAIIIAPIVALLASCASPTPEPPPHRTFNPSAEREEIAPTARGVRDGTANVRREADALRSQVGLLRRSVAEVSRSATTANTELDRLVVQKSATEAELVGLQTMFSDLTRRNMFLETEAAELERSHDGLKATVTRLETQVDLLLTASTEKDAEVEELKGLLASANGQNLELQTANERLAKAAAKAEVKSASAKTWRNIGLIVIGVASLLALAFILKPMILR